MLTHRLEDLEGGNTQFFLTNHEYFIDVGFKRPAVTVLPPFFLREYQETTSAKRVTVGEFNSKGKLYRIEPELDFLCTFDPETEMFEVSGHGIYEDILTYGVKLDHALNVLQDEMLPVLWEEYVNVADDSLSPRALEIKKDLVSKVRR